MFDILRKGFCHALVRLIAAGGGLDVIGKIFGFDAKLWAYCSTHRMFVGIICFGYLLYIYITLDQAVNKLERQYQQRLNASPQKARSKRRRRW